ncbi:hypothetical protein ABZ502_13505 [Streptomyces abikoensis]|uniref:hypothetical protein n=1 Tax=Streptomyces TaxID=1883 RepID=UPI00340D45A5
MSDSTSDDYNPNPSATSRSGKPVSLSTLGRAARWETIAILVVLFVAALVFA